MNSKNGIIEALKKNRVIEALPTPDIRPLHSTPNDGREVFSVKREDFLPHVFGEIIEHRLLSVPVVDENRVPVGFVDILDILCFVLDCDKELRYVGSCNNEIVRQEIFSSVTALELMNYSTRDPFNIVTSESTLWSAVAIMLEKGSHRLAVVRPTDQLSNVLSQLDVLRFLQPFIDTSAEGGKTVADLKLGTRTVKTAQASSSAIEAFKIIRDTGVSAIGIVNDAGKLVGNLSASDLKLIGNGTNYFKLLQLTLSELIAYTSTYKPFVARKSDTLSSVMETFIENGIHRVYVIDGDDKPIAVISPIDIIATLIVD